jgi:hypothetical protein
MGASELFGPEQRVDEVREQEHRGDTGDEVIHMPLQAIARLHEPPADDERPDADREIEEIKQHLRPHTSSTTQLYGPGP